MIVSQQDLIGNPVEDAAERERHFKEDGFVPLSDEAYCHGARGFPLHGLPAKPAKVGFCRFCRCAFRVLIRFL
jgi:hypothetical protein